jgi:hypothetical protein
VLGRLSSSPKERRRNQLVLRDEIPATYSPALDYLFHGGQEPDLSPSAPGFNVFEDTECVGDEDGYGVVGADEVGDDPFLVDAHESDVEAGLVFVGDTGLM